MHAEFARWYEAVSLQATEELLEARWSSIEGVAKDANRATIETLVRLSFRSRQSASSTESASLRTKLAGDKGPVGDEELYLLSAATLTEVLAKRDASSALAATLIRTTNFGGLRGIKQPMDLIGYAENAIQELAESTRKRGKLILGNSLAPKIDFSVALEKAKSFDAENIAAAFTAVGSSLKSVLGLIVARQNQLEQAMTAHVLIQDEELDMLWWLHGGRSSSLNIPFSEVAADQRPIVLAKELAEVTAALPGPLAIDALLSRASINDSPLSVVEAVQSLDFGWLKKAVEGMNQQRILPVTTPIHDAMKRRLEVHGENTWIAPWGSVCELKAEVQLPAITLAMLTYYEQLLIRSE